MSGQDKKRGEKLAADVPRETSAGLMMRNSLLALAPTLPPQTLDALEKHFELLLTWNRTHNLTRIVTPEEAASLHYLDSLQPLLQLEPPRRVVDIGSGSGLPGLAAAALWPSSELRLVEPAAKKVSFLRAVRAQVPELTFEVIRARCELIEPQEADLVLTRATFPWPKVAAMAAPHLCENGLLLAYLGADAPSPEDWAESCRQAKLRDYDVREFSLAPSKSRRHLASARR